jgi:hypothetical protein
VTKQTAARRTTLALEAFTVFGAAIGVQGFLSGSFDPLVADLSEALPLIDGPTVPALALAALIGVPHGAALVLGLRRRPRAPGAAIAAGAVLVGWVVAQYPLVGWGSPLQPAFAAVGAAEVASALLWRRSVAAS